MRITVTVVEEQDAFYPLELNGKGITKADAEALVKDLQKALADLEDDMIRSTSRLSLRMKLPLTDNTPEQLHIDHRCEHCKAGVHHSEWAHEDALSDHLEAVA